MPAGTAQGTGNISSPPGTKLFSAPAQRIPASFGDGSAVTFSKSFKANPNAGHLISVIIFVNGSTTINLLSLLDANGNSYTIATPFRDATNVASTWSVYLLSTPVNAHETLTFTFSVAPGAGTGSLYAEDVPVTYGPAVFDTTIGGVQAVNNANISIPSITPAGVGEFLHAGAFPGTAVIATNSPWTAGGADGPNNDQDGYILSCSSGATAVNFTQTSSSAWDAFIVAFK